MRRVLENLLWIVVFSVGTAFAADVTPPAQVDGVTVVKDEASGDITLNWNAVTTDAAGQPETISEYVIYRGTTPDFVPDKAGRTNQVGSSTSETFVDPAPQGDTVYYLISAVDTATNESNTRAPSVTTPPVLSGTWTETTIDLNWTDAQPLANVARYLVYYGTAPGVYDFVDDVGLNTSHSLTGLDLWVNYYMVVAAEDGQGNISEFSNEHADAVAGRVRVTAHDDDKLCWGAEKCTPVAPKEQRANGWQLMVPAQFPVGDWTNISVTFTMDSKLCEPPAQQNVSRCGTGNPCLDPPCNGGYNTCGDPWDRTAHLFLVLDESCITGGTSCKNNTSLELVHAVTPFGTDADAPDGRGIVPPRDLTMDITPYATVLQGEMYVGAHIGHFVQGGWHVSSTFEFSKRPEEASSKPPADGVQVLFWGNHAPPTATLSVPADATSVVTRLFTTGHGGNQACSGGSADGQSCDTGCPGGSCENCDEFCQRTNQILVDGNVEWQDIPWRDCCFPRGSFLCEDCQDWNSCGYPSCTFNRAGWCPGEIACHNNFDDPGGCDQDLDMTSVLAPGGTYSVDYNVTPLNGSWDVSLVAYWYD